MRTPLILTGWLLLMPHLAAAQSIQTLGSDIIGFIDAVLLPFLFTIAFVVFIWQMVRYFIIDVENIDHKRRARDYALYAIIAFVLMVSIWAIVNLLVAGTGLGRSEVVCPDTLPDGYCEGGTQSSSESAFPYVDYSDGTFGETGSGRTRFLFDSAVNGVRDTGSGISDFFRDLFNTAGNSDETDNRYDSNFEGSINPNNATGANDDTPDNTTPTQDTGDSTETTSFICQYTVRTDGTYDRSSCITQCRLVDGALIELGVDRAQCTHEVING